MDLTRLEAFLDKLVSGLAYPPDRDSIRRELEDHILDAIDYWQDQGLGPGEAEARALEAMGEPEEIARQLNREHSPLLGYLHSLTNIVSLLLAGYMLLLLLPSLLGDLGPGPLKREEIAYRQKLEESVDLDNYIISFDELVLSKEGTLYINYSKQNKRPFRNIWNNSYIGEIYDDRGRHYQAGGSYSSGVFKSSGSRRIEGFDLGSRRIIIDYDLYGRKYRLEIPLEVGDRLE